MKTRILSYLLHFLLLFQIRFAYAQQPASSDPDPRILMELNGFEVEDQGRGTYQFFPMHVSGQKANDAQLIQYGYIWDFGNGRYSLAAQPLMTFAEGGVGNFRLRATGFKTIKDPDARIGSDLPYISNCEATKVFDKVVPLSDCNPRRKSEKPSAWIETPPFDPVPDNCITYLLSVDLADAAAYSCEVVLTAKSMAGKLMGSDPIVIDSVESIFPLRFVRRAPNSVGLMITAARTSLAGDPTNMHGRSVVNALVHCHIAANARIGEDIVIDGQAKFIGTSRKYPNVTIPIEARQKLTATLDPSHLRVISPLFTHKKGRVTWKLLIQNDGNIPVHNMDIAGNLPNSFSLGSFKTKKVTWNGKRIHRFKFEKHHDDRQFAWKLRQSPKKGLLGDATAEIIMQAKVDKSIRCGRKDPFATQTLPLEMQIYFEGARNGYAVHSSPDVRLMCNGKGGGHPGLLVLIPVALAAAGVAILRLMH